MCRYPMDLRVSGKDLIQNHLTMCLYNHSAIWDKGDGMMPRSMYTNGPCTPLHGMPWHACHAMPLLCI